MQRPSDAVLTDLMERVKTIAVVGIKAGEQDDAFRVPRYLQQQGYRILPVSPKLEQVLGERCVRSLAELAVAPDLVNLFRASPQIPAHADEILALPQRPVAVWMRLGIVHAEAGARLAATGITVVEDMCLMVEHARLFGRQPAHRADALPVRVYYDFASTLCYVAHRALARIAEPIAALGVELRWTPIDLTQLVAWQRAGEPIDELRRQNATRVAEELGVAVRVPRVWPEARALGAAALLAEPLGRGASWRERAFTAVFEEGRSAPDVDEVARLAAEVSLELTPAAIEDALAALERHTEAAREEGVTGVPTFMLGRWPFGGIQSDATMLHVLERFARKAREGSPA